MFKDEKKMFQIKQAIFNYSGRLLERQLYRYIFENDDRENILKSILAYQNPDGGFGNGIEPDLTTPESTGIGLETALYYFDCINYLPPNTEKKILSWIVDNLSEKGTLNYPPAKIELYPYQAWWKNRDEYRILAVAALLMKMEVEFPLQLTTRVEKFADNISLPVSPEEYDYPLYLFALFNRDYAKREEILTDFKEKFPVLNRKNTSRFLLFSRYWSHFHQLLEPGLLNKEISRFWDSINENGLMPGIFPQLPWWDSIFTLDGIIAMKKLDLL